MLSPAELLPQKPCRRCPAWSEQVIFLVFPNFYFKRGRAASSHEAAGKLWSSFRICRLKRSLEWECARLAAPPPPPPPLLTVDHKHRQNPSGFQPFIFFTFFHLPPCYPSFRRRLFFSAHSQSDLFAWVGAADRAGRQRQDSPHPPPSRVRPEICNARQHSATRGSNLGCCKQKEPCFSSFLLLFPFLTLCLSNCRLHFLHEHAQFSRPFL